MSRLENTSVAMSRTSAFFAANDYSSTATSSLSSSSSSWSASPRRKPCCSCSNRVGDVTCGVGAMVGDNGVSAMLGDCDVGESFGAMLGDGEVESFGAMLGDNGIMLGDGEVGESIGAMLGNKGVAGVGVGTMLGDSVPPVQLMTIESLSVWLWYWRKVQCM
jgi:hypothetical protein